MARADEIQTALVRFTDFIYAGVFALVVRQAVDDIIAKEELLSATTTARLFLLLVVFYFLAWDWIIGRILTLNNPYQSYTRFFCEVLIAAFAYGVASNAIRGDISFIVYLGLVLFSGGIWAMRTEPHANKNDKQEMCTIQTMQFTASVLVILFWVFWRIFFGDSISWSLVSVIAIAMWFFILAYEMFVPRREGVNGGPGVPRLNRKRVRKLRRWLNGVDSRLTEAVEKLRNRIFHNTLK